MKDPAGITDGTAVYHSLSCLCGACLALDWTLTVYTPVKVVFQQASINLVTQS